MSPAVTKILLWLFVIKLGVAFGEDEQHFGKVIAKMSSRRRLSLFR